MYYLGSVTAASGGYYNNQTGASGIGTFAIPPGVRSLYLVPSASGIDFRLSAATGITAFANAANGAQLAPNVINGPFHTVNGNSAQIVVGLYTTNAGFVSVRVFGAPTS